MEEYATEDPESTFNYDYHFDTRNDIIITSDADEEEEIENWPEDGKDNIIPVGKEVVVSIHLAQRLVNAGRIKNFRIVTLQAK